jgi:tetratricopeptide (TPR) repeat protein
MERSQLSERSRAKSLATSLVLAAWAAVCSVAPAAAQRANDVADCQSMDFERTVAGCTRLLDPSRREPPLVRSQVLNNRGLAYFLRNDYPRAIEDLSEAIRLNPKFAKPRVTRSMAYAAQGDRSREMQDLDEALRIDPRQAKAYQLRGAALSLQGQYDRAAQDLDLAIRLDPSEADSYRYRSLVRSRKGDLEAALADAAEWLKRDRRSAEPVSDHEAAVALGGLLRDDRQLARCVDIFSRALGAGSRPVGDDWKILSQRGICYERSRQWERAEQDLKQALALVPDQPDAMSSLGQAWLARGLNLEEGAGLIGRAAAMRPDDGDIIATLGFAHLQLGRYGEAVSSLERALKLKGDDPTIHDRLGDAFWRAGRKADAVVQWTKARSVERSADVLAGLDDKLRRGLPDVAPAIASPPPVVAAAVVPNVSAGTAGPGRRIALVIGNSAYQGVSALPNPRRDAAAVAAALKSVGFQIVRLEGDLAREKLIDALRTFAREAASADWAVIYFAGHGLEVGGMNYLVPVDAKLESDRDVQYEAVALEQVVGAVEGARKLRLVVLDACRDNPFVARMKRTVASRSIGRGLARVEPEGGTLVAYAAKGGEIALDGSGANSPFVGALLRHLPTPGLEIGKLFRQVRDDVLAATGRKQEPFVYGSLPGEDFFFVAGK